MDKEQLDIFKKHFVCDLHLCKGACCVEGDAGAPLTKNEILSNIEEIRDSISDLLSNSGSIASSTVTEMSNVLQDFMNTATDEGQSLLELGGLLTLQTTNRVKQLGGLSVSAPNVAGKMLYENILGYYSDTLTEIHDIGYASVASKAIEPYGRAILDQFSAEKITWTERLFNSSCLLYTSDAADE